MSMINTYNKSNMDLSFINIFSPPSLVSSESDSATRPTFIAHNRHIVMELVNRIFDDKLGTIEVSSSHCSSLEKKSSEYTYDNRLKYWKNMLAERKRVQASIGRKTGKVPAEVLFNRAVTVDERDKQTVRRLIDYADRLHPLKLIDRHAAILPEYIDCNTCRHVNELRETLPKPERDGAKIVEIAGLPAVTKEELLGKPKLQGTQKKWNWLISKVLEDRIERKREHIEKLIEFYPDIEKLQVVGEGLNKMHTLQHNANIKYLGEEPIERISDDTSQCAPEVQATRALEAHTVEPDYCVKINEQVFQLTEKRSSKYIDLEMRFECEPFEKVIKRILHIENLGKKILNFEWVNRPYFDKNSNLLKANDEEFVFQQKPFRLVSGEIMNVVVQFQPRRVNIIKQKWMLKIDPQFFCRKVDAIVMRLNGKCRPAQEFVEKIRLTQKDVLDKSNTKMARQLTNKLATLTPLIKAPEVICPYKRTLNELELFEFHNPGYRCERYHDIQLLKELYQRLKKPREPVWNLKVETLKSLILRQPHPDQRALLFDEMTSILTEMRGNPYVSFDEKILDNTEREHTCYVYVRGIISAGIDEWEDLALTIEEAFLKLAWKKYMDTYYEAEEDISSFIKESAGGDAENVERLHSRELDEDAIKLWLVQELRHRKAFRDTLYMQTYTHLCNFMEDIVSVIESTDIV
ncbi:uncharacterized protein [Eurosta solidaginis]|uniref:uncharacterized protein n=1 Tax=Eurosta solidaginis TaxID=178769 RepID=UPI003531292C